MITKEEFANACKGRTVKEAIKFLNTNMRVFYRLRKEYNIPYDEENLIKLRKMYGVKGYEVSLKNVDKFGENNPNWKGGISKNNYHYKKIQKERYPEKIKAREKVSSAIRSGKLIKQPCFCGEIQSFAHHSYYSKPLDVKWLCRKHHREQHDNKH